MLFVCRLFAVCSLTAVALLPATHRGAEPSGDDIPLQAPKGWRGETIQVPPGFAPEMKLIGTEKIRFAPGMFKPDATDFFSYVLVFRLKPEPELTVETLERELLVYYQGLAKAVSKGKIKTDGFTCSVKKLAEDRQAKTPANYTAELKWSEPFATSKPQTLHFQLRAWRDKTGDHNWVFMAVSPNKADDPIWKTMQEIGDDFQTAVAKQ